MTLKKIKRSRMMVREDMLNKKLAICFTDKGTRRNFCYPIDEFHLWLSSNTKCLVTKSWTVDGIYNWPYVPEKYFTFLDKYEVKEISASIPISSSGRDYRPSERIEDLKKFKKIFGHCLCPHPSSYSDFNMAMSFLQVNDTGEIDEKGIYNLGIWVRNKRRQYYKHMMGDEGALMSDDEIKELKEIGFIFYPDLQHYFFTSSDEDCDHLIKVLQEL